VLDREEPPADLFASRLGVGDEATGERLDQVPASAPMVSAAAPLTPARTPDMVSTSAEGASTPAVFISYAHADAPVATALERALEDCGLRVWIDETQLRIGDDLAQRIAQAVDDVDFVLVLVSEASVGSNWCQQELSWAATGGIESGRGRVLPLRLDEIEVPPVLRGKVYMNVDRANPHAVVERLVADIRSHHAERGAAPSKRASAPRPHRTARPQESTEEGSDPEAPSTPWSYATAGGQEHDRRIVSAVRERVSSSDASWIGNHDFGNSRPGSLRPRRALRKNRFRTLANARRWPVQRSVATARMVDRTVARGDRCAVGGESAAIRAAATRLRFTGTDRSAPPKSP
jgi:hypothetical protein